MSVDARLITARHVSISQKYLSVRPHTALARRKSTRAGDGRLLAAECWRADIDERGSRWLITALTAVVTTIVGSGDDFSRRSESAINTPRRGNNHLERVVSLFRSIVLRRAIGFPLLSRHQLLNLTDWHLLARLPDTNYTCVLN